jgi:hypothetical protein
MEEEHDEPRNMYSLLKQGEEGSKEVGFLLKLPERNTDSPYQHVDFSQSIGLPASGTVA